MWNSAQQLELALQDLGIATTVVVDNGLRNARGIDGSSAGRAPPH